MTPTHHEITVVGLGPGDPKLVTFETAELLTTRRVFVRTRNHPVVVSMPESASWESFDRFYDGSEKFGNICSAIVDSLLQEAEQGPIVYGVPGHPLFGDVTVLRLFEAASDLGTTVRVAPAVSFLDSVMVSLGIDPVHNNLQIVDPLEVASIVDAQPYAGGKIPVLPLRPAIVPQVGSLALASAIKQVLQTVYPNHHEVTLVTGVGGSQQAVTNLTLPELDRPSVDLPFSLYVPALDPLEANRVPEGLQQIIARLRAPGGCPWDREQTHESLTRHMLEEAYEVIHAIESGSSADLSEELGDVLLQVYLHAQIAEEAGEFTFENVVETVSSKLVRRHPHVFGDRTIESSGEVLRAWDQIKQAERAKNDESATNSPFRSIPPALPALAKAQTIVRRARLHGIDVNARQNTSRHVSDEAPRDVESQIAGKLMGVVSEADRLGVDSEQILRRWATSFIQAHDGTET